MLCSALWDQDLLVGRLSIACLLTARTVPSNTQETHAHPEDRTLAVLVSQHVLLLVDAVLQKDESTHRNPLAGPDGKRKYNISKLYIYVNTKTQARIIMPTAGPPTHQVHQGSCAPLTEEHNPIPENSLKSCMHCELFA